MDVFASFATDESLESEGKWFPLSKTARVKVARAGNPRYTALLRARLRDAQMDLLPSDEAEALAETIILDVMSETVLLDWEGLTFKGAPAPVTVKQAREFLSVKDFRKKISGFSENFEAFKLKAEADQKND